MKLKEGVQQALDEGRMLIMGIQVLLGFDLQIFLMRRFEALPHAARSVKLAGVMCLLAATILILAPAAFHRIVEGGKDSSALYRFTRGAVTAALAPFAIALGIETFVVVCVVAGPVVAGCCAALLGAIAVAAWFVYPRALQRARPHSREDRMEETSLNDKIRQVLTEARVVLPGTQALLGFELVAVFQDGFDSLSPLARIVHLAGLAFLALSIVFLMLPAAFHRIAEQGEISERLHRVASASILGALVTLALGIGAALFVVVEKTISFGAGLGAAAAWLATSLGVWFGLMLFLRQKRDRTGQRHVAANAVSSGA